MEGWCSDGANSFALVGYLRDPLASFVDRLRAELAPGCRLRAHLTVLPPRPLEGSPEAAWDEIRDNFQGIAPVSIQLQEVRLFEVSEVVYISVGHGCNELIGLHERLNQGRACFCEVFKYHPHVTLAQDLPHSQVKPSLEVAQRRWQEYSGPREFTLDRLTFVQNQPVNGWSDLAELELKPLPLVTAR